MVPLIQINTSIQKDYHVISSEAHDDFLKQNEYNAQSSEVIVLCKHTAEQTHTMLTLTGM